MAERTLKGSEAGNLAIASCRSLQNLGASTDSNECDECGLFHISEVSCSWIKNLSSHIFERQKFVLVLHHWTKTTKAEGVLQKVTDSSVTNISKAAGKAFLRRGR